MRSKFLLWTLVFLACISFVSAEKSCNITRYTAAPNVTLSLVEGTGLAENTTYFYRAVTTPVGYYATVLMSYSSAPSVVANITTNSTHKRINISLVHSTGVPEHFNVWVHEGSNPGIGNWTNRESFPNVFSLPASLGAAMYFTSYNTKANSYVDVGARSALVVLGGYANYAFVPFFENEKVKIICEGGTEADPLTLHWLLNYSQAQGWNESVIYRLDYNPYDTVKGVGIGLNGVETSIQGYSNYLHPTYVMQPAYFAWKGYAEFKDMQVVLIGVQNFRTYSYYGDAEVGSYDEDKDYTSEGVDFIVYNHGFSSTGFSWAGSKVYDSSFRRRPYSWGYSTPYNFNLQFQYTAGTGDYKGVAWEIVDVILEGGSNNGLYITNGVSEDCLVRRFTSYQNRYTMQVVNTDNSFQIDDLRLVGDRSGFRASTLTTAGGKVVTGENIVFANGMTGQMLWLFAGGNASTTVSRMNLVNPVLPYGAGVWDRVSWYWVTGYGGVVQDSCYVNESYTFDLKVLDVNQTPISGAEVVLKNVNNDLVINVSTNSSGLINETIITIATRTPNASLVPNGGCYQSVCGLTYNYNPFNLVIHKDGKQLYNSTFNITKQIDWTITPNDYPVVVNGDLVVRPSMGNDLVVIG